MINVIYQQIAYIKALYTEKTVFDLVKPFWRKWHLFMVKNAEFKGKMSFLHHGYLSAKWRCKHFKRLQERSCLTYNYGEVVKAFNLLQDKVRLA